MRDTLPSLFLSAEVKLGVDEEAPALALPLMPELELWPELEPEAAEPLEDDEGVCALVLPLPDVVLEGAELEPLALEGVCADVAPLLDLSPAANEAPDSARSAAAVALTRTFIFIWFAPLREKKGFADKQRAVHASSVPVLFSAARPRRASLRRRSRSTSPSRHLTLR